MVKKAVIVVGILLVCILGYVGLSFIFSSVTVLDTASSIGELCDIVLNFTAIFVTLLLGVVVYFQSERINNLEAAQYDIFIGIERVDMQADIGTELQMISCPQKAKESDVSVFRDLTSETLTLLVHTHMNQQDKKLFIPIMFITRNAPLITSIRIKQIDIIYRKVRNGQNEEVEKCLPVNACPICCVLPDNSHFILHFGVHGLYQEDIDEMNVKFHFKVEDQLKRSHNITTDVLLSRIHKELRILSSKTNP